jgi:paraquat-inducible protein A
MAHAGTAPEILTAREAGLIGCGTCGRVVEPGPTTCPRCGSALHGRRPASLEKVMAWWLAGLIAYIPANLYPMLRTTMLGRTVDSNIIGGVVDLVHHGALFVASVVFLASVVIPVTKFIVIGYLVYSMRYRVTLSQHRRTMLYEAVEFIGRWSMVDVFVVAILTALVNLGFIVGFKPGTAAVFFALSVAFTMVSALSLDPRLIWDRTEGDDSEHG